METLGQKFRAAREKKRITLSKAAASTRIKIQNLEMMESDDFTRMPAPTYAKGFIRIYANFLGLDPAPLVQEYVDQHLNPPAEKPVRADVPEEAPVRSSTGAAGRSLSVNVSWPALVARIKQFAQQATGTLQPHLSKIGIAFAIVVVVMLISRCMSGLGGPEDDLNSQHMRSDSIAREPAERYLDLPATEPAR